MYLWGLSASFSETGGRISCRRGRKVLCEAAVRKKAGRSKLLAHVSSMLCNNNHSVTSTVRKAWRAGSLLLYLLFFLWSKKEVTWDILRPVLLIRVRIK